MKVSELIKFLSGYSPDIEVRIYDPEWDDWRPITGMCIGADEALELDCDDGRRETLEIS